MEIRPPFYEDVPRQLWEDEMGTTQDIPQGEGGKWALGLHRALTTVRERLLPSEKVFCIP